MSIGVSVIVPTRNGGSWLVDAVRSAASEADEIVVVDDGGNDAVLGSIAEHGSASCALRIVPGPGKGPGAARNIGQATARHDIAVFLDADDLLVPGWRDALVAPIAADRADFVLAAWRNMERDGRVLQEAHFADRRADPLVALVLRPTVVSAAAARRPWPVWDESLAAWEVARWQHDAVLSGGRVATSECVVTHIRQHHTPTRVSIVSDHFGARVCGGFWSSELARLGDRVPDSARRVMAHHVLDSVYSLLRSGDAADAQSLFERLNRRLVRSLDGPIGGPRWLAARLGLRAMALHARLALLREGAPR